MNGDETGQNPSDRLLVTADEVAKLLGISTRTWWRLCSARRCPAPLRIGGNTRWRKAEVERWVDKGCPDEPSDEPDE